MSRYISFMGKRVEAQYRVADIHQKSVGTLVADTGRCIVIEEHLLQGERKKTMRVEISLRIRDSSCRCATKS
jgi:hypothetical protein